MEIRRVLLASKVTLYELFGVRRRDQRLLTLVETRAPIVAKVEASHRETVRSREVVLAALGRAGVRVSTGGRSRPVADGRFDLIVVLGGDETVLDVARNVTSTPILAVNSSPTASVGHFCLVTADAFEEAFSAVREGRSVPSELARIRVRVDGEEHPHTALNDVLFAHTMTAATSRYNLRIGRDEEEQKSSGVWVSTAAGSTAAMRSAGGTVLDPFDRRLQYRVREPFYATGRPPALRLLHGLVGGDGVTIVSRMMHGGVYLDGRRTTVLARYASRVDLTPDAPPLRIFLPERKR